MRQASRNQIFVPHRADLRSIMSLLKIPANEEWGPLAWQLLHGLAERFEKTSITNIQIRNDQSREFLHFLRYLEVCMPCKKCRDHFSIWRKERPLSVDQANFKIKQWLYDLHTVVNKRRGLEQSVTFEDLSGLYGSIYLIEVSLKLWKMIGDAVQLQAVTPDNFKNLKIHFGYLIRRL